MTVCDRPLSALDGREAQRHPGEPALADGEPVGDLLQRLGGGRLRLGEHDGRPGVAGLAEPGVQRDLTEERYPGAQRPGQRVGDSLAAAEVAERAGAIATQTHQQVVGVVENMSWLDLPDGSRMELFGSGGGEAVSDALTRTLGARVPLLGQIPLDTRLREAGDVGAPIVLAQPDSPAAQALEKIAENLAVRQRGLSGMSLGLTPVRR